MENKNKLFIDESNINRQPSDIWTYCALYGTESEIDKKYRAIVDKIKENLPGVSTNPPIKYSKITGNFRSEIISHLFEYSFDFTIAYCNEETQKYLGSFINKDKLRRQIAQLLILNSIEKGKIFSFVVFDSNPFSAQSFKKIERIFNEKLKHNLKFSAPPSKTKPALQIADLLAGSARAFLTKNLHKEQFHSIKNNFLLFHSAHANIKLDYSSKMEKSDVTYCFEF